MNLNCLDKIIVNEPKYRLKQAKEAVFKSLAENWSDVLNFPPQLREKLNKECPLEIRGEIIQSGGSVGASKAIIILDDGLKIESVLMSHKDGRNTVCVSSQAGNIGARKISISTSGIIEGIEKLAKEKIQVNLAVSLHAPDDDLRSKLMPVNKKYPLAKVLRAVDFYIKRTYR